jgi:hypothetical protein
LARSCRAAISASTPERLPHMPSVFISHAHSDKLLARSICALLRDALALKPEDFFTSSEEGRGVSPAANIQQEVLAALASAPSLIVVLTPKSALSRWVWLEAGTRLGQSDRANPLFVCPSARFASLLGPVGDNKALNLDNEDELVELVQAVGKILGRPPRDYLSYKPALADLATAAANEYSAARERRAALTTSLRHYGPLLAIVPLMLLAGFWYGGGTIGNSKPIAPIGDLQLNEAAIAEAARYLILTGTVVAQNSNNAVPEALVMASRDPEVKDQTACTEPTCTFWKTDTEGKFRLDLTKIRGRKDETVTLIVVKPGFETNKKLIEIDVRAMDSNVAPQSVRLAMPMQPTPPGTPQ